MIPAEGIGEFAGVLGNFVRAVVAGVLQFPSIAADEGVAAEQRVAVGILDASVGGNRLAFHRVDARIVGAHIAVTEFVDNVRTKCVGPTCCRAAGVIDVGARAVTGGSAENSLVLGFSNCPSLYRANRMSLAVRFESRRMSKSVELTFSISRVW